MSILEPKLMRHNTTVDKCAILVSINNTDWRITTGLLLLIPILLPFISITIPINWIFHQMSTSLVTIVGTEDETLVVLVPVGISGPAFSEAALLGLGLGIANINLVLLQAASRLFEARSAGNNLG